MGFAPTPHCPPSSGGVTHEIKYFTAENKMFQLLLFFFLLWWSLGEVGGGRDDCPVYSDVVTVQLSVVERFQSTSRSHLMHLLYPTIYRCCSSDSMQLFPIQKHTVTHHNKHNLHQRMDSTNKYSFRNLILTYTCPVSQEGQVHTILLHFHFLCNTELII